MPFPKYLGKDVYEPVTNTNWSLTVNDRSRVSFIPISQEYVGWFDNNANLNGVKPYRGFNVYPNGHPNAGEPNYDDPIPNTFALGRGVRFFQDVAGNLASTATYGGSNSSVRFTGKMFQRNYPIYYTLGTPRIGNVYNDGSILSNNRTVQDGGFGIPYDLYVKHTPLSQPQGTNDCFTDTEIDSGDNNEAYEGSNCVGIIAARQKIYKPGGGTLNIEARQCLGMVGDVMNIGFNRTVTPLIIPGGAATSISFSTNNFVPPKTLYYPVWGSTSNAIYSFGGSILHAMVWDAWPDPLTVFVPQYFAVMHFNPGVIGSTSNKIIYDNVDFSEYTLSGGTLIDSDSNISSIRASKRINTSLRGLMVTGGIKYYKTTIAVNNASASIEAPGAGYIVNDTIFNSTYKIGIKVTSVDGDGGITRYEFYEDEITGDILDGEDIDPGPFAGGGIVVGFPSSSSSQTAYIKWQKGIVKRRIKFFEGPKQRSNLVRLTDKSDGSTGRLEQTKNTSLSLENNFDAPEPGQFEVFYFFHSDIAANPRSPGVNIQFHPMRHITLTIS